MLTKKYYLISEVALMLNISAATLRYVENKEPNLQIHKIRKRRYYSFDDIELIKSLILKPDQYMSNSIADGKPNYTDKIDNLLQKFKTIKTDLIIFLNSLKTQ